MDVTAIASLAGSVVAVLAPYLAKAGEEIAKEAGKATANKVGLLYQTLKDRFKTRSSAKEALADLEAQPNDPDVQAALRIQLKKQMTKDQTLVDQLQQLLSEIKQDQETYSFLTQVYGGNVDSILNIGELKGNLTIDKRYGKSQYHH